MDFNFDFVATQENARSIIQKEQAPEVVKRFLLQGLLAFNNTSLVHVKAVGHLFNDDYQQTIGELLVEEVRVRECNDT